MPTPRKLVAVAAVALGGVAAIAWLLGRAPSGATVSAPRAEPRAVPADAVGAAPGLEGERSAVESEPASPPADAIAAEPAPAARAGWTAEQVDGVLDSFRGDRPRTAELLALVDDLAAGAVVDEASLRRDQFGRLVGRIECVAQGLAGEFTLHSEQLAVTLRRPPTGGEGYAMTDLKIVVPLVGSTDGGNAAVQHHPDVSAAGVWNAFGAEASVIGWNVGSTVAAGTNASPVLAKVVGEGTERAIAIGPPRAEGSFAGDVDRFPAQRDPWRYHVAGFEAWRAKLAPYQDR